MKPLQSLLLKSAKLDILLMKEDRSSFDVSNSSAVTQSFSHQLLTFSVGENSDWESERKGVP